MRERARSNPRQSPAPEASERVSATGAPARQPGPTPAQAMALQRAVGNRAAMRTLARWAAHPDKDKKGQFLTDSAAEEYTRFNPPKNS